MAFLKANIAPAVVGGSVTVHDVITAWIKYSDLASDSTHTCTHVFKESFAMYKGIFISYTGIEQFVTFYEYSR